MRVGIHRGTKQIGGTCIEIEADGKRIVLDVGLPLDADRAEDIESLLPHVAGFKESDDSLLAVVISHPHQDHYGLARFIRPEVPVFIGEAAHRILQAARPFVPNGVVFDSPRYLENKKPTKIEPFTITPYLVDHSAFDAYSLLIEAGGKQLFYSGDFRGHGNKSGLFEGIVKAPPKDIDALLMEGSTIGRGSDEKKYPTEKDLIPRFTEAMKTTMGMCLVWASSQNIDRIVAIQKASNAAGRQIIMDFYTAEILRATGNDSIIGGVVDKAKIFIPQWQRVRIKNEKLFEEVSRYYRQRIYSEFLPEIAPKSALLYRPSFLGSLEKANCLSGAHLIYSIWEGYQKMEPFKTDLASLEAHGIGKTEIHTSGHASVPDLKRFAQAINPKMLVPIHSFETQRYPELFENVVMKNDGEWWSA